MSSHGGLATSFAFQEDRKYIKFAVFYYAWIMTPDNFMRHQENVPAFNMVVLALNYQTSSGSETIFRCSW